MLLDRFRHLGLGPKPFASHGAAAGEMARAAEAYQLSMPLQMPNQALHLTGAPLQPRTYPQCSDGPFDHASDNRRVTIKARSR
jgi:hypothetical protein